ncbi:MAG: hypothetical protein Q8M92_05320, partial [Candidatus Subteraquimicrobiales bacterium]|nr:hypothetical protein [Candidatus Subteraquimicrobiales bacterium]
YEGADKYIISIEEANWSYSTAGTKVEVGPGELQLIYGTEYMWEIVIMSGEELTDEIVGFFSLAAEDEIRELTEIEGRTEGIEPEQDRCMLWAGILEEKEFYIEAIEQYKKAYALEPSNGVAYRIAYCYDKLELEELRDKWNRKILEENV